MSRKSKKKKIVYEAILLKVPNISGVPLLGVPLVDRFFKKKRKAFNYIIHHKKNFDLDFFIRRSRVIGEWVGIDVDTRRNKKIPFTMGLDIYFLKPGSLKLWKKK